MRNFNKVRKMFTGGPFLPSLDKILQDFVNPYWGAIAGVVQTGVNAVNLIGAEDSELLYTDLETKELVGSSYIGSYDDISTASQKSGKYGLFNRKGFKQANADMLDGKQMQNNIQNINQDNQSRLAMAANTLMNAMNYANKLNGGIDFNNLRIGKLGFKLENLDRCRKIKTTHVVNVDTKRIEEFKPEISDPAKMFKEGGSFTPIITDVPFVPVISEVESFKEGGTIQEELVKLEETNLKNVIPEGALHKNKHHIEHTEGLTLKGIPVIDNDGLLLAEIELNEIIFTLEVTKKLEKLHQIFKEGNKEELDKAAIEAGRLLVHEILYNTDDRTDLISKCEKGGKL